MTKESTSLTSLVGVPAEMLASYARFVCALSLQNLKGLLARMWTSSAALDMSTRMITSHLYIRIRLHWKGDIRNFHHLAVSMFSRQKGEQIFLRAANALDVLGPSRRNVIVSISTDGELKMRGFVQIVTACFEQDAL